MMDQAVFVNWLGRYKGKDFVRMSPSYCPLATYVREHFPLGGVGMTRWWEKGAGANHELPEWAQTLRQKVDTSGRTDTGGRKLAITRNEVMSLLCDE